MGKRSLEISPKKNINDIFGDKIELTERFKRKIAEEKEEEICLNDDEITVKKSIVPID